MEPKSITIAIAAFIIGLVMLIKGSDIFVDGAANAALKLGVSEHIIGITLVAFATSLPELAASIFASIANLAINFLHYLNVFDVCYVVIYKYYAMFLNISFLVT